MRGLRKQETEKFQCFFALIQAEAEKHDAVFFADAGDGHEFETATMEGENMMGWLIPTDKVEEFEPLWQASDVNDAWTEFFVWAIWAQDADRVVICFEEQGGRILALIIGVACAERFSDGTIKRFFHDGTMLRWLERLEDLNYEQQQNYRSMQLITKI